MSTAYRVLCSTGDMPREEWLKRRRVGIGSSDAAAVAGLDPWRSPLAVYLDKRGEAPPDEDSEAAYWGRRLEPLIREDLERRFGPICPVAAILQHPEHDWMIAEPDGRADDGRVVEIKTTGYWSGREWDGGAVPERVVLQVQHQLAVTGAPAAIVAALIGGQRLVIRDVPRDDDLIASLIEVEHRFWHDHVLAGAPPEPDGSEAAGDLLRRMYPEARPDASVLLDATEAEARLAELLAAQDALKAAERKVKEIQQWFEAQMKDAEYGLIRGVPRVRWQTVTHERVDVRALSEAYPDLAAEYRRESTYRRFQILREEA